MGMTYEESEDRQQKTNCSSTFWVMLESKKNTDWDSSSHPRMETNKTPTNEKS
jgi:hypothetical protein